MKLLNQAKLFKRASEDMYDTICDYDENEIIELLESDNPRPILPENAVYPIIQILEDGNKYALKLLIEKYPDDEEFTIAISGAKNIPEELLNILYNSKIQTLKSLALSHPNLNLSNDELNNIINNGTTLEKQSILNKLSMEQIIRLSKDDDERVRAKILYEINDLPQDVLNTLHNDPSKLVQLAIKQKAKNKQKAKR